MRCALLTVMTLLVLSCGTTTTTPPTTSAGQVVGGGTTTTTPPTTSAGQVVGTNAEAEAALAQSMLLTLSDFPTGTAEKPRSSPTAADPLADCQPSHPPGSTGYADTAEFSRSPSASDIEERIYVFASAEGATAWLDHYPAEIDCIVRAMNAGKVNSDTATLREASSDTWSLPRLADTSPRGYTVMFSIVQSSATNSPQVFAVTIDTAVAVVGRIGFSVDGGPFGFSSGELTPYLERAVSKIAQRLK